MPSRISIDIAVRTPATLSCSPALLMRRGLVGVGRVVDRQCIARLERILLDDVGNSSRNMRQ